MNTRRFAACLCMLLLSILLIPAAASAKVAAGEAHRVPVGELLEAGDYVEGEALAVVREGAEVDAAGQVEEVAEVSTDSVELAAAGALNSESALDDVMARRVKSADAEGYAIKHVVDHSRTTEQILRELYDDPDVVSAEPNYLVQGPAALDDQGASAQSDGTALGAASAEGLSPEAGANPADLTFEQWSLDGDLDEYGTTPRSPTNAYSMNVPGWASGRTSASAPANATEGTVCIMDTGIDTGHPDLAPVLFDFSTELPPERYSELQAEYGCGKYGLNASGSGEADDVTGYHPHGTHVAGIVAAQWNDFGVSGIANGTKIFALRIFGNDGSTQDEASLLKGFEFLVEVSKDTNLKAVNCSWGGGITQFSYEAMVNELGKKGVNVVYASGNRTADLDETMDNGGMSSSPYSITVDAAQPDGKPTEFTCYGQASTDVFAPGTQILSTVPRTIERRFDGGTLSSRSVFQRFFPEATDASNLLAYETFGGDTTGVRLFKNNPAINAEDPQEITGFVGSGKGYGDTRSAAVNVSSLNKGAEEAMIFTGSSGYVYLAVPLQDGASADDVKYVAMDLAMSDSFKPTGGIASITCNPVGGGAPVEVDTTAAKTFHKDGDAWCDGIGSGWLSSDLYTVYQCQWSPVSFNVDEFIEYSNHAHEWLLENPGEPLPGERSEAGGYEHYADPGEVAGVHGWEDGGKTYVIVKVGIAAHGSEPSDSTELLMDNVAVGTADAYVASYENMPGTSMAAPAVTGCLAVIAKGEKANKDMTDDELEQAALERASKLLASVDYDDDLAALCRTGGRVNLRDQSAFETKAPIITCAVADGDALAVTGHFFGASGMLAVDDAAVPDENISSWSDSSATASLDGLGLANGSHVLKVTNAEGAVMRMTFSYSSAQATGRPLYERTHALPIDDARFIADKSDRLSGAMVYCDGSVYALTAEGSHYYSQAMWRYDTEGDTWSRCALPPECVHGSVRATSLFVYGGNVHLVSSQTSYKDGDTTVWRYDAADSSWREITLADNRRWPDEPVCVLGDDLIAIGLMTSDLEASPDLEGDGAGEGDPDAGEGDQDDGSDDGSDYGPFVNERFCARIDMDAGTIAKIEGAFDGDFKNMSFENLKAATSAGKIYLFASKERENDADNVDADWLVRLTYDKANNTMKYESLRSQLKEAIGTDLVPAFESQSGGQDNSKYIALAGLPDGVAIVGSSTLGEDTHVIKDDSTQVLAYGRTSSYHRAFEPLAAWGDDGFLYVAGVNATEPGVMYFRSTHGAHIWDAGVVTKQPAAGVAGERTHTCTVCGERRTEAVPALPGVAVGSTAKAGGNTYKVTSNKAGTVVFAKAKNAKNVVIPATVKLNGKTYKVVGIKAKAFAFAKNAKVLVVKTKKLTKKGVKNSLKGSKVKVVKVRVGSKKANKRYAKKYAKYFTKANCGKKVKVKA